MTDPADLMASLEQQLKPYRNAFPSFARLPETGLPRAEVAELVERLAAVEESRWRDGYASGAVYHGDREHVAFLNRVYAAQSQSNPAAPGSVAERYEVRGGDRRDDRVTCWAASTPHQTPRWWAR